MEPRRGKPPTREPGRSLPAHHIREQRAREPSRITRAIYLGSPILALTRLTYPSPTASRSTTFAEEGPRGNSIQSRRQQVQPLHQCLMVGTPSLERRSRRTDVTKDAARPRLWPEGRNVLVSYKPDGQSIGGPTGVLKQSFTILVPLGVCRPLEGEVLVAAQKRPSQCARTARAVSSTRLAALRRILGFAALEADFAPS